jgi:hypothetical protein
MAGASNSGPPNEVVITLEPPRSSWRRNEERHTEAGNDTSTLGEWLLGEAAWLSEGSRLGCSLPRYPAALPFETRKRVCLPPGPRPLESRLPGAGRPCGEWIAA